MALPTALLPAAQAAARPSPTVWPTRLLALPGHPSPCCVLASGRDRLGCVLETLLKLFLFPCSLHPENSYLTWAPSHHPQAAPQAQAASSCTTRPQAVSWSSAAGVPPWSRPWGVGATVRPSGGVLGTAVRGMPQGGRPLCLLRGDWWGEEGRDPRAGEGGCWVGSPRCPKSPSQCHPGIPHRAKRVCLPLPLSQPESVCPSRKDPGWEGSRPCLPVHPGDCQASQRP